jgi:hypothetical protein
MENLMKKYTLSDAGISGFEMVDSITNENFLATPVKSSIQELQNNQRSPGIISGSSFPFSVELDSLKFNKKSDSNLNFEKPLIFKQEKRDIGTKKESVISDIKSEFLIEDNSYSKKKEMPTEFSHDFVSDFSMNPSNRLSPNNKAQESKFKKY